MLIVYAGVTNRNGEVACATNTPIGGAQVSFSAAAGVVYYFAVGSQTFAPGGTASRIAFSLAALALAAAASAFFLSSACSAAGASASSLPRSTFLSASLQSSSLAGPAYA